MSWFSFFLTFFVWFNMAPFATTIQKALSLSEGQLKTLFICNIALTIPGRIVMGMLVDRFGPRKTNSLFLIIMSIPCFLFAFCQSFEQMVIARILLSLVGAGFVIGIRMIGEWFTPKEVGLAQGIYGGWGNFGSAAAAFCLPLVFLNFFGVEGWRYAAGFTGTLILGFVPLYYHLVRDTPSGKTYFSPDKVSAMEVSSYQSMISLLLMTAPIVLSLALITWKLQLPEVGFITREASWIIYGLLVMLFIYQVAQILRVNVPILKKKVDEADKYEFKQVSILNVAYGVCFGAELAVISMLPAFLENTYGITVTMAGIIAGTFPLMNLAARPLGGVLSDKWGRKNAMVFLFAGLSASFFAMSKLSPSLPLILAVLIIITASIFVQAACGAVFSIVPLIKRRVTGQIAGMVGAYGNIGAVLFLLAYSFTGADLFFLIISGSAVFTLGCCSFLKNPRGAMMEIQPDGSVEMLEVA